MKTLLLLISLFLTFLTPVYGLFLLMLSFVIFDTSIGIYTSIKLNGIESFKSHKLFNFVIKLLFYCGTILIIFMIDTYIIGGVLFGIKCLISKVVTSFFIYVELKSIDEKIIRLGYKSMWVQFKDFIDKLKSVKKDLHSIVEDDKDDKEDKVEA